MALELDSGLTFETLVVGSGNRLAYAAARRVAEAPGTSYNPLFIYSASGLGKTHLLHGIGHHARGLHPDLNIVYDTLEGFIARVTEAFKTGKDAEFRMQLGMNTMLLLDDVQFLAGQHRMQEELLRAWDQVAAGGGQVVLTSDRPPPEIDGLDQRLLSRFSGGLIMDVAAPDYETRVAIVRRIAERRGQPLSEGVPEALARSAFGNVRELQGGLNQVFAVQELEGRTVDAGEVAGLLGSSGARAATASEFDSFLADITETVADVVAELPGQRQLGDAVGRWRTDGYRTGRLEAAIGAGEFEEAESLIRAFERDVERLREIAGEVATLEPEAAELTRTDVLRDPERVTEAEALLADVRSRNRPLPAPPAGDELEDLSLAEEQLVVKAAYAITKEPGRRYNPLFVWGAGAARSALLSAAARRMMREHPDMTVAYLSGGDFADELIGAIETNEVETWRARYRRADALFIEGVEALEGTELAQEELFHLFDALARAGAQLAFGAARPPAELEGLENRLRSRLEAGLVADVDAAVPDVAADPAPGLSIEEIPDAADDAATAAAAVDAAAAQDASAPLRGGRDDWFRSPEKLIWVWPYSADWVIEELG